MKTWSNTWLSEDVKKALRRPNPLSEVSPAATGNALSEVLGQHLLWLKSNGKEGTQGYLVAGCAQSKYLENKNFSQIRMEHFDGSWSSFHNCTFDEADLRFANFRASRFFNCSFKNADLRYASFANAYFSDCNFTDAVLFQAAFPYGFDPAESTSS